MKVSLTTILALGSSPSLAEASGLRTTTRHRALATTSDPAWTEYVESDGSVECDGGNDSLVGGFGCKGAYCDDVRLYCSNSSTAASSSGDSYHTASISEETAAAICNADYFMIGVSCSGHYCDNISLQCAKASGRSASESDCAWSRWVSEEGSGTILFTDAFVRGIECRGGYCDDKRFYICPFIVAATPTDAPSSSPVVVDPIPTAYPTKAPAQAPTDPPTTKSPTTLVPTANTCTSTYTCRPFSSVANVTVDDCPSSIDDCVCLQGWTKSAINDQCIPMTKLLPSDLMEGYKFGNRLAYSGNTLVVGNYDGMSDDGLVRTGSVYVFEKETGGAYQEIQKLVPSDPYAFMRFGIEVSISGNTIIAKASFNGRGPEPRVYVFERADGGVWLETQRIDVPALWSMAIDGDTLVLSTSNSYSANIYTRTSGVWGLHQTITYSGGSFQSLQFGKSVAIYGDTIAVGSPTPNGPRGWTPPPAKVVLYARSGSNSSWTEQQTISKGTSNFGDKVALTDSTLAVEGSNVFTYEKDATTGMWSQEQLLSYGGFRSENGRYFRDFKISGDVLLIGGNDSGSYDFGAVFVHRKIDGAWSEGERVVTGELSKEYLGEGIAVGDRKLFIGTGMYMGTNIGPDRVGHGGHVFVVDF